VVRAEAVRPASSPGDRREEARWTLPRLKQTEGDRASLIVLTLEQIIMRTRRLATAAATALVLGTTSASSGANQPVRAPSQLPTLVTYKEEQSGVASRFTRLIVSADRRATVRFEGCTTRFHLNTSLWKRLRAALKQTNLHVIAGDHAPPTPRAEESTWVITVGHDTVRISDFSIPQELRAKLEPLLKVLEEVRSVGEQPMPPSCSSKRTEITRVASPGSA
jgi:hypothetical protein